ncbi:peptidoglycan-recognition protein LE-like isoform X2 [Maniola hyperantus]|uniref:peptidoglycan-recognition protein LE-like isoform X2 n=1 Tax=Aphantopus hyperantus TaxID=2795564 RepID=UPI001568229F|nr:peptidoglycan-recognition protein LC-like isoform X2 [Maniola hyperantus]
MYKNKMALKLDRSNSGRNLGVRVAGDLGDLQVTDASSDCDDKICDNEKVSRTVNTVNAISNLPPNLIHSTAVPSFGRVAITNSENVQFGNNTYFNGPVTIKQIIQSKSGVENSSYTRSDDENISRGDHSTHGKIQESSDKKVQILVWHKITFSAVCFIVIGSIIATVLVLQNKYEPQQQPTNGFSQPDFTMDPSGDPLLIAPDHLRIVSRTDWLAQPVEGELDKLVQPVPWVIITHTATENCHTQSQCVLRVRLIQTFHIESRGWYDIGYNFLIGGDGSVYYGRGWDYEGAHSKGYNKYSIGIAFIGTFNNDPPPKQQVEACEKIIKQGVQLGKLRKDYKLFVHRQLMSTLSPGDKVIDIVKEWPHYVSNLTDIDSLLPKIS